jgi:hypothetical protein
MAVGSSSSSRLPAIRQLSESTSVLAARAQGQENTGIADRARKKGPPLPLLLHNLRNKKRSGMEKKFQGYSTCSEPLSASRVLDSGYGKGRGEKEETFAWDPFAVRLSESAPAWRQLLAPIAEWVSRVLWSTLRHNGKHKPAPTHLTQSSRRDAKGVPHQHFISAPQPPHLCRTCGGKVTAGFDRCKSCKIPNCKNELIKRRRKGAWPPTPQRLKQSGLRIGSGRLKGLSFGGHPTNQLG